MSDALIYGVVPEKFESRGSITMLANSMLAFAVFLGGFVIIEPAPYELMMAALLGIWYLFGLKLQRTTLPLLVAMFLFATGGFLATSQMPDLSSGLIYMAVTFFLGLTSVFFASVIHDDMGRLRLIFRSYLAAAIITSLLGIIGYFGVLPGFEVFTRYSRAMGAFEDPNVFGPFLVLPTLYLIYGLLTRSISLAPIRLAALAILLVGILLSFSRAAWGLVVISTLMMYLVLLLNEQDIKQRLKFVVLAIAGVAFVVILLTIALQFEAVSKLFEVRARAVQDYDGQRLETLCASCNRV